MSADYPHPSSNLNHALSSHLPVDVEQTLCGSVSNYIPTSANERISNDKERPCQCMSSKSETTIAVPDELPPVDKGVRAWSFLIGAFFVEVIVWSIPNAFGVFLAYYLRDLDILSQDGADELLPLIGTLSSGVTYCTGPFAFLFAAQYPHYRRLCLWSGIALCWISLFSSSYTKNVSCLVFSQGALWGLGGVLLYAPCLSFMAEWFDKKCGVANGIVFAGTSVGGLVLPISLAPLIDKFGIQMSLRILSFIVLGTLLCILPVMHPRLPESSARSTLRRRPDSQWYKDRPFWIFNVVNTLHAFVYFIPLIWLPTFASDIYPGKYTEQSLPLSLLNGLSIISNLAIGFLSDRMSPWIIITGTLIGTSLSVFILWGALVPSLTVLSTFGIMYGIFAGGWCALWTPFLRRLTKDDTSLSTALFGLLMFFRGLGNILSTPIATGLVRSDRVVSDNNKRAISGFDVADGRYKGVMLYVGICFSVAALVSIVGWRLDKKGGTRV